ncbi:Similar to Ctr copper transporter [Endocarpon pusillum]; acc. no. AEH41533 [Pyronema omphalodes CBS 100304]|uniref:Copper transport protein n=1 Tax=Pyronema omphalodes (strain CBS 100304) TaxID=1076935 RepID=U4LVY3_PYROM|nr:Similar to Ctr copper transporter [Endocarpon pusillum]; acc. no. AEH41533 [Pyronema omphalodes CBS 100304]
MADFTQQPDYSATSGSSSSSSSSSHDMTSSGSMSMVFYTSTSTPLFSSSWSPSTLGQYVGVCVFLIVLCFIFRFLLAWKSVLEHGWKEGMKGKKVVVAVGLGDANGASKSETTSVAGGGEKEGEGEKEKEGTPEVVLKQKGWGGRPFRFSTELKRSCMTTLVAGTGYLM